MLKTASPLRALFTETAIALVLAAPLAFGIHAAAPLWPFLKIYSRLAIIGAGIVAWRHVRLAYAGDWAGVGLARGRAIAAEIAVGLTVGMVAMLILIVVKLAAGTAVVAVSPDVWHIAFLAARALLQALLVATFEEIFFRGCITGALIRAWSPRSGILAGSLLFSAVHFLRPWPPAAEMPSEFFGLFMAGVALALSYRASGALYVPIGVHTAWVFLGKFDRVLVHHIPSEPIWFWGRDRLFACALAWPLMLAVAWTVHRLSQRTAGRASS